MKKQYTAAIMGQGGLFSAIRSAWASRFHSIRAFVMVPSIAEKLELRVHFSQQHDDDIVHLTSRNWKTGEERTLYHGSLTNGSIKPARQRKD